ncbi:MAG: hypothetical protein N2515_09155 [Deltaproteobacteria bacterium]|nr:hypothetical protein [Deltaproteobacteria bacterium]
MSLKKEALEALQSHLLAHPQEIPRAIWHLLGLKVTLPLDAIRWVLERVAQGGWLKDPILVECPPGLRLTATIEVMGTPLRVSGVIYVDRLEFNSEMLRVEVRLEEVSAQVVGNVNPPAAALIRSGALDLSKPGELIKHFPLPPIVVEAHDKRIVVDLLRDPKIGSNTNLRRWLSLITPIVTTSSLSAEDEHLELALRPLPQGIGAALRAIQHHLVRPGLERIRTLLPPPHIW